MGKTLDYVLLGVHNFPVGLVINREVELVLMGIISDLIYRERGFREDKLGGVIVRWLLHDYINR